MLTQFTAGTDLALQLSTTALALRHLLIPYIIGEQMRHIYHKGPRYALIGHLKRFSRDQYLQRTRMANAASNRPHDERTSSEPRDSKVHLVRVTAVEQVNSTVRTIRLSATDTIAVGTCTRGAIRLWLMIEQHRPGQWVDLHIPSLARPGGFTITSTPYSADSSRTKAPHIDLAVQTSTISP